MISAHSRSFADLDGLFFPFSTGYAWHPNTLRWVSSAHTGHPTAMESFSKGDFQLCCFVGMQFDRYVAVRIHSGYISSGILAAIRIHLALVSSTPPERSAEPFCSGVYLAEYSIVIPNSLSHFSISLPIPLS